MGDTKEPNGTMQTRQPIHCLILGLLAYLSSNPSAATAAGPTDMVAHWKLDESTGTLATDSTGNGIDGTYNNLPLLGVPSKDVALGTAVDFDGSNDYVEVPHDDRFLADDGTVLLWFNINDLSIRQGIFSKDSQDFDTGGHLTIFYFNNVVNVRFQSTSSSYSLVSPSISVGIWYHVAFTWGTNGIKLFVDGVEVDANPAYTGGMGSTSGGTGNFEPLVIGAASWFSADLVSAPVTEYFNGTIDDVRFYNRALLPSEIQDLFNLNGNVRIINWVEVR